jgi:hypothetical protein
MRILTPWVLVCLFVFTIEKTKETEGKRKVVNIEYNLGSD